MDLFLRCLRIVSGYLPRWFRRTLPMGLCFPLLGSSIITPASTATAVLSLSSDPGPLSQSSNSVTGSFVSASVLTGNLDRWYSSATLPSFAASTPQQILLSNMLDSTGGASSAGSGLGGFNPDYIAMLEAEIVAGPSYWTLTPPAAVVNAASITPARSDVAVVSVARPIAAVPEPGTLVLLGGGLFAFAVMLANRAGRAAEMANVPRSDVWPDI